MLRMNQTDPDNYVVILSILDRFRGFCVMKQRQADVYTVMSGYWNICCLQISSECSTFVDGNGCVLMSSSCLVGQNYSLIRN